MMLQTETCLLDWWFEIGCGSALRNERCPNLDDSPTSVKHVLGFLSSLFSTFSCQCLCLVVIAMALSSRFIAARQLPSKLRRLKLISNLRKTHLQRLQHHELLATYLAAVLAILALLGGSFCTFPTFMHSPLRCILGMFSLLAETGLVYTALLRACSIYFFALPSSDCTSQSPLTSELPTYRHTCTSHGHSHQTPSKSFQLSHCPLPKIHSENHPISYLPSYPDRSKMTVHGSTYLSEAHHPVESYFVSSSLYVLLYRSDPFSGLLPCENVRQILHILRKRRLLADLSRMEYYLVMGGRPLDMGSSLDEAEITENTTIEVRIRMRAGSSRLVSERAWLHDVSQFV